MALGATLMLVKPEPTLNPNPPPNCTFCQKSFLGCCWAKTTTEKAVAKKVKINLKLMRKQGYLDMKKGFFGKR
jgi:hypothetical protein